MCQLIDSEVIIGNMLIEATMRNIYEISMKKFVDFDNEVTSLLLKKNISTRFSVFELTEFKDNYPYFLNEIKDDEILLKSDTSNNRLIKYFRTGLPKDIVNDMVTASKKVFDR